MHYFVKLIDQTLADMSSSLAAHLQDVAALPRAQERAVSRFLHFCLHLGLNQSSPFSSSTTSPFPHVPHPDYCSLIGAAVADAASRPLHWVYDMTLMEELMKVRMGRPP